jgi:co-chaperonin GroES (HSP10)
MDLKPLPGNIFAVLQLGERTTAGGIIMSDDNGKDEGIRPRWARVWKVADDIDYVQPGDWILCEHGRWTMRITVKDDEGKPFEFVKVDPNGILIVSDEAPEEKFTGF